jgi:hypothetical protein
MVGVTIVATVNCEANEVVLTALQQVIGATLKNWLSENKAQVLEAIRAAAVEDWTPPPVKPPAKTGEAKYLSTAAVAARWHLHPETVRRLVREGRLPRMYIGRRSLVPLAAIVECEQKGWVPSRR